MERWRGGIGCLSCQDLTVRQPWERRANLPARSRKHNFCLRARHRRKVIDVLVTLIAEAALVIANHPFPIYRARLWYMQPVEVVAFLAHELNLKIRDELRAWQGNAIEICPRPENQ